MANNTRGSFSYKASRDIFGVVIGSLFAAIGFLAMYLILGSFLLNFFEVSDVLEALEIVKWMYIVIAIICIVCDTLYIVSHTFYSMEIKEKEIVYHQGWFSKSTTSIPAHKIRSCTKTSGPLQRFFGTMTIKITTAGDSAEIYFANIGNGEVAYQMLCEMAIRNEQER